MPEILDRTGAMSAEGLLIEFDRKMEDFADLCRTTKALVETILAEKGIFIHSVQARVKKNGKLVSKYSNPEKDYKSLNDISDVVGLRIITYYADAIDNVEQIIRQEFAITLRDDKRIASAHEFGYSALHMDCKYSPARLGGTEYKRFLNSRFEIQITTILGHAWAEMYHPWYDNRSVSLLEDERGFHRLAAVLELADQEFVNIRTLKEKRDSLAAIREGADLPTISPS